MDSIKTLAVYLYFPLLDFVHILHVCYKPWCVLLFRQIFFFSDLKIGIKSFMFTHIIIISDALHPLEQIHISLCYDFPFDRRTCVDSSHRV